MLIVCASSTRILRGRSRRSRNSEARDDFWRVLRDCEGGFWASSFMGFVGDVVVG